MKKSSANYIAPLPPKEQMSLYRWYTWSIYIITGFILVLACINAYQYTTTRKLHAQYQTIYQSIRSLQDEPHKAEQLTQELELLKKQISKVENLQQSPFNPMVYLKKIAQQVPADVCLLECTLSKDTTMSLQGYSHTTASIITFLQSLEASDAINSIHLVSLTPQSSESNDTWFQFSMRGTLKRS